MERVPYVKSVSIGIVVDSGVFKESEYNNGISHFIEHMLFRGTKNRTGKDISIEIDNIGGELNAFTSKEKTCYYSRVLGTHLDIAIDILSDMILNPLFQEDDILKEKQIIEEEISMYLDDPEDLTYELLNKYMLKNSPLSRPILGSFDTIKNLDRKNILEYYNKVYRANNIIISVAGNFNIKETLKLLEDRFNKISKDDNWIENPKEILKIDKGIYGIKKDVEQFNYLLGFKSLNSLSEYKFAISVLDNIMGGSVSSRLFQKIREDMGLAYTIYSSSESYIETGIFSIFTALKHREIFNVSNIINAEIKNIKLNLVEEEFLRAKEQLKGSYIINNEKPVSRMFENAKSIELYDKIVLPEEIINNIDAISMEDMEYLIYNIFDRDYLNIAYVGNSNIKDKSEFEKNLLDIFDF